jgi:hypothetical protein
MRLSGYNACTTMHVLRPLYYTLKFDHSNCVARERPGPPAALHEPKGQLFSDKRSAQTLLLHRSLQPRL